MNSIATQIHSINIFITTHHDCTNANAIMTTVTQQTCRPQTQTLSAYIHTAIKSIACLFLCAALSVTFTYFVDWMRFYVQLSVHKRRPCRFELEQPEHWEVRGVIRHNKLYNILRIGGCHAPKTDIVVELNHLSNKCFAQTLRQNSR